MSVQHLSTSWYVACSKASGPPSIAAPVVVARWTNALAPGAAEEPSTLISEPCCAACTMSNIAELAPCGPHAVMIWVPWYETWFGAAAAFCSHLTAVGESAPVTVGTATAGMGRPIPIRAVLTSRASRDRLTLSARSGPPAAASG